jgi:Tol biopolymer transport system component
MTEVAKSFAESRFIQLRQEVAVIISKKTMAAIIFAGFIFLALTSAAIQAETIAFVRGHDIWIANLDGSAQKQLTFTGKIRDPANFSPSLALSPDGQKIAYSDMKDIYLISTSGGAPVKCNLPGLKGADYPFFSSDGSKLLFLGKMKAGAGAAKNKELEMEKTSISMLDLNSGQVKNIIVTENPADFSPYDSPSLSPRGNLIAVQDGATDVSGGFSILNENGKSFFHFPPGAGDDTPYWRPLFSADGKKILCFSPATNVKGSDIIYLVDIDSATKTRVAEGLWPTFVDNGRAIVYERWNVHSVERNKSSKSDLWLLELREGAQPKKIIADAASPTGQTLR